MKHVQIEVISMQAFRATKLSESAKYIADRISMVIFCSWLTHFYRPSKPET